MNILKQMFFIKSFDPDGVECIFDVNIYKINFTYASQSVSKEIRRKRPKTFLENQH